MPRKESGNKNKQKKMNEVNTVEDINKKHESF